MVVWETYGLTDIGMQRLTNEDAYAIVELSGSYFNIKVLLRLLAVADGMGGHKAGEVASKKAISYLTAALPLFLYNTKSREEFEEQVKDGIRWMNKKICALGRQEQNYSGMGTTLTSLIVTYYGNMIVHVGDSRAYIFSKNKLERITKDHTFVQKLLDADAIDEEEARTHPRRHELLQCIGVTEDVNPDIHWINIDYDDIVLLCSDGLTEMLSDTEIEAIIRDNVDNLENIVKSLLRKALDAGGDDNVTIVLGRLRRD